MTTNKHDFVDQDQNDKPLTPQELESLIPQTPEDIVEDSSRELSRRDIRSLAFHLIYAMEQFDYTVSLESIIDMFERGFDLEIPADSFAITLAREAIDKRVELDELMVPYLKNWTLERLGCCTKLILRLALVELLREDAVPSIVINEAVELAKAFTEKDAYKFINGVLDEYVKSVGLKEETRNNEESQ